MGNRTDFGWLAFELAQEFELPGEAAERIETELHNAYVAGQEGKGCACSACKRLPPEETLTGPRGAGKTKP